MAAKKKAAKRPPKKPAGSGAAGHRPTKPTLEIPTGNFGAKIYVPAKILETLLAGTFSAKVKTGKTKAGTSKTKAKSAKTKTKTTKSKAGRVASGKPIPTGNFGAKAARGSRTRTRNFGAKR